MNALMPLSALGSADERVTGRMWPVGWEALEQWGDDVARVEPLGGGVVNEVWSLRVNGQRAAGRLGARSDTDLAWETDLLRHLDREGLSVPVPIATRSGRLFADGLVVMSYVEGEPPETAADWRRVADSLRQLHRLTEGWPQRPGWRSSIDLLTQRPGRRSTSARCRLRAWPDAEQRGRGSPAIRPA
jgi:Ser/Thr protein kinase RdoA (MazF antagonist)